MTHQVHHAEQFRLAWAHFYPDCLPLGWVLRVRANSPWVRFHALPGSKRYANNRAERESILARGNALAGELLGADQCCWVVDAETHSRPSSRDVALSGTLSNDPNEPIWNFYARSERWQAGTRDAELLSIADGAPRRTIWMRRDNGAVFAPYDGGFDLFPPTWSAVDQMKARWPDWLSDHPTGL